MTHVSLKNAILVASVLSFSAGISAFAETTKLECATNPLFVTNECDICYTEKYDTIKTASGWTAELSTVKVPWEHGEGELGEVILESAQTLPEILSSTGVIVTPTEPDDIWEFDTDIVWYPVGSDNEFYIEKGVKNNLYTLKTGVKLAASGKTSQDTILLKTHLVYEDYEINLNETTGKTRNICILGKFDTVMGTVATPIVTDAPVLEEEETPLLNAAAPEEEVEITPEQTETKAGPEFWIFLLLAFALSSAWTAWNKQKV